MRVAPYHLTGDFCHVVQSKWGPSFIFSHVKTLTEATVAVGKHSLSETIGTDSSLAAVNGVPSVIGKYRLSIQVPSWQLL